MVDFHSHIVYDVDDGAQKIENSVNLIKEAKEAGFDKIILTPHYMEDYYIVPKSEIEERIKKIKEKCEEEKIEIDIFQGNEIYITNHIIEYFNEKIISSLNNSRYVLFETPLNFEPANLVEVIYKLKEIGKVPVLAHPERYSFIQKDPNKLYELFEMGVLFQANYGSIIGMYGESAKKTVKLLLKNNYIHFLGSDVHREKSIYHNIEEAMNEIRKIIGNNSFENISNANIIKVINDEEIEVEEPSKIKIGFFSKLF